MRKGSDKSCRESRNTRYLFNIYIYVFFFNAAVREIKRKNIVERGRLQMTIWRMRITCWIPDSTDKHSKNVILIAIPLKR
jgi:hypothetical protein